MGDLVVSEIFGPTFQGEGPSAGRQAMFLRLGRCSLDCRWCDSAYTWDWERYDPAVELTTRPAADVLAQLDAIGCSMLVVTGGEPMLQQSRLAPLLAARPTWRVEVETNGTIAPSREMAERVDQWNVSPKLSGSGVARERAIDVVALRALVATGRAIAKFVVTGSGELAEADEVVAAAGFTDVWVMPEGTTADAVTTGLAALTGPVLARGWNLSNRLHIQLWGDERGR